MLFGKKSPVEKAVAPAALGLLGGVAMSWPLWSEFARIAFPSLPLWGNAALENSSSLTNFFQPIFTAGAILFAGIFSSKKWPLALLALLLLWLCALDVNRLQPWVWFYLLIFAVVFFEKKENETATINALRWLLAAVYFWGGFSKTTPYFAEDNFVWFCEAFAFTKPFGQFPLLGYGIALLEMTFAAGILWEKTRRHFKWLIIGFHAVIVIFLLKLDWNWVVVPWNVAMAAMVWTLAENPVQKPMATAQRVLVVFIWLTPALAYLQLWPQNLAWQLYSNTQLEATFYTENEEVKFISESGFSENHLQKMWQKHSYGDGTNLLLDDWSNDELKVPMFNSERTFRQLGKYLCTCISKPDSAGVEILKVNRWDKSAEKMEKIPCRVLLKK